MSATAMLLRGAGPGRACLVVLALLAAGCTPEADLAVAEASLLDGVEPLVPEDTARTLEPVAPPTAAQLRIERAVGEITRDNAREKAAELEKALRAEVRELEARLAPVDVDMGGE